MVWLGSRFYWIRPDTWQAGDSIPPSKVIGGGGGGGGSPMSVLILWRAHLEVERNYQNKRILYLGMPVLA